MQHHPRHHCSPNVHTVAASIFGVFSLSMSPFHVTPRVREINRGMLLHCFCLKRLLPIAMYRTSTAAQFVFCHRRLSPLQKPSAMPADRLPPQVKSCFKDFFGDTISLAADVYTGDIWCAHNGEWVIAFENAELVEGVYPVVTSTSREAFVSINLGEQSLQHPPPSDEFTTVCTHTGSSALTLMMRH